MSTAAEPSMREPDVAGRSDIGCKRSENQDHFMIADLRRQLVVRNTDLEDSGSELYGCKEGNLLVVADGMGGHDSGERASRIAIEMSSTYILDMMRWFLKLSTEEENDFLSELSSCLSTVQKRFRQERQQSGSKMGTTLTIAYVLAPKLYVVHAGDTRCYRLRDDEIRQLTTDHTIAQQLVESGGLSQQQASESSWRHVLWNCIGGQEEEVRPEVIKSALEPGDKVLLCSDGLSGVLDDREIHSIIQDAATSTIAVDRLIERARDEGGPDNITAIVYKPPRTSKCTDTEPPPGDENPTVDG